ncbi:hypothetical protein F2P56_001787 [Juglans regia]|uniref:SET domain-containing protein n=1 Tax=Juglans regia TaxID=51240 RepID=A0A833YCP4_JUGRE|nr:hypothetical protein F2P56_001787 [Juglans regia]
METICSIDAALASEISHLLTSPSPPQVQEYFDNLISTRKCHGIKVKPNGEFGKGVYADLDFKEGELVFKDQMLVGAQHCSNKIDCLVCSFCFCFIGSIELQIGRRLYLQGLGVSMNHGSDMETFKHISKDCSKTDSNNGEYDSLLENHDNLGNCASSSSKQIFTIPKDVVESLMNGELMLPYSKQFSLPPPVPCAGGCGEAYYCRWWDCVALPDDVDSSDESAFRMQIRELAFTSLQLLKAAIFDKECEPLFSLETYGHIIGMFELNNLDLVVASPVEDYFLYIDDLPYTEKQEAEQVTQPFLDALGDDYSVCCQGTGFFPLQSCMNHSCCPNAKAFKREEDRDGQATLIALGPISKGEEVTISYVDEDLPFEERQALLADYGFKCKCPKCLQEET